MDSKRVTPSAGTSELPGEVLAWVREIFTERIPFNRVIGLDVESVEAGQVRLGFAMREELVGNFVRRVLHGGVISSVLDVTGGLVAFLAVLRRGYDHGHPPEDPALRFSRLGTIDLRVDYLRPGSGARFVANGFLLRSGSRVAVTRTELQNDAGALVAVGTGTYIIG